MLTKSVVTLKYLDSIEYWKSSPYLLNIMKGYELKRAMSAKTERPSQELLDVLGKGAAQLLRRKQFDHYRELEPANARLRALLKDTVGAGQWRLLWVPPSLPYWQPQGAYADQASHDKSAGLFVLAGCSRRDSFPLFLRG